MSYVVYWSCEDFGQEIFKVSLSIYNKDILQVFCILKHQEKSKPPCLATQVSGVSYLLWILDCYQSLHSMVRLLKQHQEVTESEREFSHLMTLLLGRNWNTTGGTEDHYQEIFFVNK